MYRVETITSTLLTTDNKAEALALAEKCYKAHAYTMIEVKEVITETPYQTKSVKIFWR